MKLAKKTTIKLNKTKKDYDIGQIKSSEVSKTLITAYCVSSITVPAYFLHIINME